MGYNVQIDLRRQMIEVAVDFDDDRVFCDITGSASFRPKRIHIRPQVCDWLDTIGGDWGVTAWIEAKPFRGQDGIEDRYVMQGKIFQFGDRKLASLFILKWLASESAKELS